MSVLEMNQEQVELYATLGLAITQWAHVEQSLLKVYWDLTKFIYHKAAKQFRLKIVALGLALAAAM